MLPSHKRKALIFLAIAIVAMLILEAGISNMTLRRGEPFAWNLPEVQISSGAQIRPMSQNYVLLFLFVIALLSVFLTRDGRKKLLFLILGVAVVTFILYHFKPELQAPPTLVGAMPTQAIPTEAIENIAAYPAPAPEVFQPNTPGWLITVVGVGFSLVLAAAILALFWIGLQYRQRGSFSQAFSQEVQAAIDALEAGVDLKDAISRCYAQMSRVLQEERGLVREEDMTPREFEGLLAEKGFPAEAVETLTRLFEQVRYGHIAPGEGGIQAALSSLSAIRDHCQALKTAGT